MTHRKILCKSGPRFDSCTDL